MGKKVKNKKESVWDVVGADNLIELPPNTAVAQDKVSMLLYALFLRDDYDSVSDYLQEQTTAHP